jgi:centrosomal protein CEP76
MDFDYPITFSVIKKDYYGLSVVGVGQFDWRKVLTTGRVSVLVELMDHLNPEMTVGILDVNLEFTSNDRIREDEFEFHLKHQAKKQDDMSSKFFIEAKQWWNDYLQMRESHATRLVKIFALDEFGKRSPVTQFLQPINCILY